LKKIQIIFRSVFVILPIKGRDILTESQQYRLCYDLLQSGYKVYVTEYDLILNQVEDRLKYEFGDRIVFGVPNEKSLLD
jgi:hypothetical protein